MKTRTYAVILWLYVNAHVRGTEHLQHLFYLQLHSLLLNYRKIPNISPGVYIFQRPFLRGLFLEGLIFGGAYVWREILRFKINWASLIVRRKFTVFALFSLEFEGNFQVQAPGELIFGGAI